MTFVDENLNFKINSIQMKSITQDNRSNKNTRIGPRNHPYNDP